jgi:drug/metabolite transporter (DMT)-like permease
LPYLRLLGAQVAIGAAAIFARFALSGAGPLAVSALRLGIAALIALAIALPFPRLSMRREVAFACAGAALALHFAAWIASLLYTSVAISTLLVTTTPLWTQLYESARERRAPERSFVLAVGLALAGVALIVFGGPAAAQRAPVPGRAFLGEALALVGSGAIGAYLIIVRDAGARHAAPLPTRQIVARTYGWSTIFLIAAALVSRESAPATAAVAAWSGILAMAIVSQLIGHTALNAALRDFSPKTIALTTLVEPVIAAAFAAAIFREALSPQTFAGGGLVLAAVGITLRNTAAYASGAAFPAVERTNSAE